MPPTTREETKHMQSHEVTGGGGITLRVDETGNETGQSILFIHGYSQSRLAWDKQMHSDLVDDFRLAAMDLRGHGGSEKPENEYADPELWADDVQGVIEELGLDRPVLVGWSYGGGVIMDYLKVHGEGNVAGVNLLGSGSKLGEAALAEIGDALIELVPGLESTDAQESAESVEAFVGLLLDEPAPQDLYYFIGFNSIVPPYVRQQLIAREGDRDDLLADLGIPVLITHAEDDPVVLPAAAEHNADLIPNVEISWYPDDRHALFWDASDRFNRELREFVLEL